MTAPKQEIWVHQHKASVNANIIASIGAAFDFYAGTVKRPGPFWIKLGLEWFIRLWVEPKRLWKRNFVSTPLFLWDLLKEKFS
jgi:N-acetylglucosaminyldiphosphoundecaprenol N-acetyl-beta-D-mannosaminyltransferase